jgi:hypothetical protein
MPKGTHPMKKRIEAILKESGFVKTQSGGWEKKKGNQFAVFYWTSWTSSGRENFIAYYGRQQTEWTIEARPSIEFAERFAMLAIESLNESLKNG